MVNFSTIQRRKTLERYRQRRVALVHNKSVMPWHGYKLGLLDADVAIDALERLILVEGISHEKKENS